MTIQLNQKALLEKTILDIIYETDDKKFKNTLKQLNKISQDDLIPLIIDYTMNATEQELLCLSTLLEDIKRLTKLPYQIIVKLKKMLKDDKEEKSAYPLLYLYSTLFLTGYPLTKSFFGLLDELKIDIKQFETFNEKIEGEIIEHLNSDVYSDLISDFDDSEENDDDLDKINDNIVNRVKEITPFSNDTAYSKDPILFKPISPFKVPIHKYLQDLDSIANSEAKMIKFIDPVPELSKSVHTKEARKFARIISKKFEEGEFKEILRYFTNLIQLEPKNPVILYYKAKVFQDLFPREQTNRIFSLSYKELEKCLKYATNEPYIEYYQNMALNLQLMGYFKCSYILNLKMLKIMPNDQQLNIAAAYCAYQLLRPFQNFILTAALSDYMRTLNFLNEFWYLERFKPQDRLQKQTLLNPIIKTTEKEVVMHRSTFFEIYPPYEDITQIQIISPDFPFDEILGYTPILNNDISNEYYDETDDNEEGYDEVDEDQYDEDDYFCFFPFKDPDLPLETLFNPKIKKIFPYYVNYILPNWNYSPEYSNLPIYTWKDRDEIPFFIIYLMDTRFSELPINWVWENLTKVLLENVPRYEDFPKHLIKSIGRVLGSFCDFMFREFGYLNLKDFSKQIKPLSKKIIEKCN